MEDADQNCAVAAAAGLRFPGRTNFLGAKATAQGRPARSPSFGRAEYTFRTEIRDVHRRGGFLTVLVSFSCALGNLSTS